MTKVRLLVARAGHAVSQSPGDIIEVAPHEAASLIAAGQAEPIQGECETAMLEQKGREPASPRRRARKKDRV